MPERDAFAILVVGSVGQGVEQTTFLEPCWRTEPNWQGAPVPSQRA